MKIRIVVPLKHIHLTYEILEVAREHSLGIGVIEILLGKVLTVEAPPHVDGRAIVNALQALFDKTEAARAVLELCDTSLN